MKCAKRKGTEKHQCSTCWSKPKTQQTITKPKRKPVVKKKKKKVVFLKKKQNKLYGKLNRK